MFKILFFVSIIALAGFLYSPYEATSRFAKAVVANDAKTIASLTDHIAYRESLKENLRPLLAEYLRRNALPSQTQMDVIRGTALFETQIDVLFNGNNIEQMLDSTRRTTSQGGYEIVKTGWRSPFAFTAVDNQGDTKLFFQFDGFAGWKLTGFESSEDVLRVELKRQLKLLR